MPASKTIGGINVTITATNNQFERTVNNSRKQLGGFVADAKRSVPIVNKQVERMNKEMHKTPGIVKSVNHAMRELHHIAKAASAVFVFSEFVEFGRKIREHIEHIHSWADAWRELKASIGVGKSAADSELEQLEKLDKLGAARMGRMDAFQGALGALQRKRDVMQFGESSVLYDEELRQFGRLQADQLRDLRQTIGAPEKTRNALGGLLRDLPRRIRSFEGETISRSFTDKEIAGRPVGEFQDYMRSMRSAKRSRHTGMDSPLSTFEQWLERKSGAPQMMHPLGLLSKAGRGGLDLFNQAHAFANQLPQKAIERMLGWFKGSKGGGRDSSHLMLPESGSVESYRQQAAIRKQAENIAKKHLKVDERALAVLQNIDRKTLPVAEAGIG